MTQSKQSETEDTDKLPFTRAYVRVFTYLESAKQDLGSDTTGLGDAIDLITDSCVCSRRDNLAIPSFDGRSRKRHLEEGESSSDNKCESPHGGY